MHEGISTTVWLFWWWWRNGAGQTKSTAVNHVSELRWFLGSTRPVFLVTLLYYHVLRRFMCARVCLLMSLFVGACASSWDLQKRWINDVHGKGLELEDTHQFFHHCLQDAEQQQNVYPDQHGELPLLSSCAALDWFQYCPFTDSHNVNLALGFQPIPTIVDLV